MTELPCRDDNETTTRQRRCPICGTAFLPRRRQTYDTNACRQIAYRRRQQTTTAPDVPPARSRRDDTVYLCTDCDTRYLGDQWCHDCNKPCIRLDRGGLCPHCEEPVTLQDLTATSASH